MQLFRYGKHGAERPGLRAPDGRLFSLAEHIPDINGDTLQPESLDRLRALDPTDLPPVSPDERIAPCASGVGKIIGCGLNYADHAPELGLDIPTELPVFLKATTAINGPFDDVIIPPGSLKTDWEVELAFVIGRLARRVDEANATDHIAGYCIMNDITERYFQLELGGQWTKGKSCDSFAPIGPWLVTPDEIPDPHNLDLWCEVDGERRQTGNTQTMIFRIPWIVAHLSQVMTLAPGDIVTTGTPPGVGVGRKPQVFLRPGQEMRAGITGLGEQRQRITQG